MLLQKELGVVENSYYEASVARPAVSPALEGTVQADVCVVGGGYAGLSAALELALRGHAVVLLEAQRVGWGASGRNGGQAIVGFGSDGERAIERQLPREDARRAFAITEEGLDLLRDRIATHAIACEWQPGYLSLSVKPSRTKALRHWMDHVEALYGYPLEWIPPADIGQWVASARFHAGVFDTRSGHLHPLKYCLGLAGAARGAGVRMHENSVAYLIERGDRPVVKTAQGEVHCNFVVLAGNVYLAEYGDSLAPSISTRIMPVGTYMIATEPLGASRADALLRHRAAASDTNFVLDYFRVSADHRLLFGAGDSYSASTPRHLVRKIRANLLKVFPQLSDVDIPFAWGGFADITMNRSPDFGRIDANIYYLQGFSGHGLVTSGMAGKLAAEAIAGQAERFDLFARLTHRGFPGGARLRTPALVLGMLFFRLRDML
ncbi:FAD-dependent oxidoreductase [Variovorax paradoxus]|uniref:FAD-dependent oxidoreductase n=1 Tax=Variovorax paradoxus TaxID=34073 RepID=A0A5Q0MCK1_VARPD|nr:FAD-binding oxidoreductase [Variovorax paradoxus]QFZ86162.1 FAD-dependent oxidoreductase [Variovorax paradoxus]